MRLDALRYDPPHNTFHGSAYPTLHKSYIFENTHIRNLELSQEGFTLLMRANFSLEIINVQVTENLGDIEYYLIIAVM